MFPPERDTTSTILLLAPHGRELRGVTKRGRISHIDYHDGLPVGPSSSRRLGTFMRKKEGSRKMKEITPYIPILITFVPAVSNVKDKWSHSARY